MRRKNRAAQLAKLRRNRLLCPNPQFGYTPGMGQEELGYITGDGIETRHEVTAVKRELGKIGIFLEGFGITVTGVYTKPRPGARLLGPSGG